MDIDGRREPGTGGFRQHPGNVMKRRDPVESKMTPSRVLRHIEDAREPGLFFLVRNMGPIPAVLTPHKRICIRPDRFGVRWNVEPCTVASHVMMVEVRVGGPS